MFTDPRSEPCDTIEDPLRLGIICTGDTFTSIDGVAFMILQHERDTIFHVAYAGTLPPTGGGLVIVDGGVRLFDILGAKNRCSLDKFHPKVRKRLLRLLHEYFFARPGKSADEEQLDAILEKAKLQDPKRTLCWESWSRPAVVDMDL